MDTLACDGTGENGARIHSSEMIQLWRANQLDPRRRASFDTWRRMGYSFALGVRVDKLQGGREPIGEFGWDGAAGSWALIDPYHQISAFYAMHVCNFGYAFDVIHPALLNILYEAISPMD